MKNLVSNFTNQLREALQIGAAAKLTEGSRSFSNIVVTGLGGSGIGGTILSDVVAQEVKIPMLVNKDYFLPAFVDERTLLIVCSYSGNTEETLMALEEGERRKAKIVCVSSGGRMLELAAAKSYDHIRIPGGLPPRACLGYSLPQLFFVLHHFALIGNHFLAEFQRAIALLDEQEQQVLKTAHEVASKLLGKIPVIYSVAGYEGVAVRFRQQINENSKELCWHHVVPEMNHNELVGWKNNNDKLAVVIFRNEDDFERSQTRLEINKAVIAKCTNTIIELHAMGSTRLERALYDIHLGDWITVFIAELKNIDPVEVKVIDFLKGELSKS